MQDHPAYLNSIWLFAGPHGRIVNIMAISVGDEFETYESFKCKTE